MEPLRAALAAFVPYDDTEARDVERAVALLDACDPWSRDLPVHMTASALVVHRPDRRVLLRWHPRLHGWFQVGGHADPGESDPWAIAVREAQEETGLADLTATDAPLSRAPVQVVAVSVPAGKGEPAHEHVDVRYLLATATPELIREEGPDAPLRWFTPEQARAEITEPNLRVLLERAERRLDQMT